MYTKVNFCTFKPLVHLGTPSCIKVSYGVVLDFVDAIVQFQPIISIPLFAGVALIVGLIAKWLNYDFWKITYRALFAFMIFVISIFRYSKKYALCFQG